LRVVADKLLCLFSGVGVGRSVIPTGKSRRDNVMAHPPHGSAQKERI